MHQYINVCGYRSSANMHTKRKNSLLRILSVCIEKEPYRPQKVSCRTLQRKGLYGETKASALKSQSGRDWTICIYAFRFVQVKVTRLLRFASVSARAVHRTPLLYSHSDRSVFVGATESFHQLLFRIWRSRVVDQSQSMAVSYTHLTLPTKA